MQRPPNMSSFDDLPPPHLPSNSSSHHLFRCFSSRLSILFYSLLSITHIFLLPLLILVLYLGFQRWRKRRSTSTAATSHSDVLTYHSIAMQLNEFLGFTFVFCGGYMKRPEMMLVGVDVCNITSFGQVLFHILTCVERYLAVVHPVTYLGLKQAGGVRLRNISIVCVWFLSFGWLAVNYRSENVFKMIFYFCMMFVLFFLFSFCSISVLCALKHPGPGEVGGKRERVDQSKQRAFNTILAIMGVSLLGFGGDLLVSIMYNLPVFSDMCVAFISSAWFNLPGKFLLPLLFLQRAGKLQRFKQNSEPG